MIVTIDDLLLLLLLWLLWPPKSDDDEEGEEEEGEGNVIRHGENWSSLLPHPHCPFS